LIHCELEMGNWCSSEKNSKASSNVSLVGNPKHDLNNKTQTSSSSSSATNTTEDALVTSEYNTIVLGAGSERSANKNSGKEPKHPTIILLPHQHTLFCERKVKKFGY
jgi:hypothetical protein